MTCLGAAGSAQPALRLSPVLPLVLYTGQSPWQNNRTLHDLLDEPAEFHGFVPQWGPLFWQLSEHSADSLLDSGDAWQQTLAGQDHIRWYDLLRIILSWGLWRRPRSERPALLAAAQAIQADSQRQKEVGDVGQTIAEEIWEEGWTKGLTEGVAKGLTEGVAKGQLENSRGLLRRLLTRRFGTVPEGLLQQIEATTDVERLNAAAVEVLQIDLPEELQL